MGRPLSPYGRRLSRLNATKHATCVDGIMKSMGPRCPFLASCPAKRDQELAAACIPGEDCPVERAIHDAYLADARRTFSFARQWLSDQQFEETIAQLAIVNLQRQRLSALIARDGIVRPRVHPVSKARCGLEPTLAAGRYESALTNRWNDLMSRILTRPGELGVAE